MGTNPEVNQILFFDGACNLCNSSVNFIIDRDPKGKFRFAPLQSQLAMKLLPEFNINPEQLESLVLFRSGKVYRKSRAALEVARQLTGFWPMLYVFIIVPWFIRNFIYDLIAKNRYRLFGRQATCRIPTPELKARFVDSA
jgi:predicted DCC family thiol-disulfide oxidoreductase YuxK